MSRCPWTDSAVRAERSLAQPWPLGSGFLQGKCVPRQPHPRPRSSQPTKTLKANLILPLLLHLSDFTMDRSAEKGCQTLVALCVVHVCACVHACVHWVYVCACVHVRVCVWVCACVCMCTGACRHAHVHVCAGRAHVWVACMHMCACMCALGCTCVQACVLGGVCVCVHPRPLRLAMRSPV